MVVKLLGAASVLAAAAGAQGAFAVVSVDAGGFSPSTLGTPLGVTGGGSMFVFAGGGNTADPATHNLLAPFAGVGGAGIGMVGIQSNGPAHVPGTNAANLGFPDPVNGIGFAPNSATNTVTATQLQGFWFVTLPAGVPSGPAISGDGSGAVWIARLGVSSGNQLDIAGSSVRVGILEGVTQANVEITAAGTNLDLDNSPDALGFFYRMVTVFRGSALGQDVYDVYAEQFVPTPGAAALLGVAGLAAVRRRRA